MRTFTPGFSLAHPLARFGSLAAILWGLFCGIGAQADQTTQLVPGTTITVSVTSDGTPPFSYQWKKNGNAIFGATQSALVLPAVTSADVANYSVSVSNTVGATTSDLAIITAAATYAPSVKKQPTGQSLLLGDQAQFTVTASGTVPLTYQWKKDGVAIPGATDATLFIDPVTAADFGSYTVVVTNVAGIDESKPAILTDATIPPSFDSQLIGQDVLSGSTVSFTLVAGGTAPISYQWRINGKNLADSAVVSGSNGPTLTLTNVTTAYSAVYSVIATNSAGSVSSNSATLNVSAPPPKNAAPVILTNPISRLASVGETVAFSGSASALPNPTYQWQKNGVNLASLGNVDGADTPNLTLYGVKVTDAGDYTLKVTNSLGTATTQAATLVVRTTQPPSIITQPVDQAANLGSVAFFTLNATAFPAPTFQWQKNGTPLIDGGNIQGSNRQTLSISNISAADAASYTVVVSNSLGSVTSNAAALNVTGLPAIQVPTITSQSPSSQVVPTGTILQLAVSVVGDPIPTLQWQKNGSNLSNGGNVSGATTATLTLNGVTTADGGNYTVVATNSKGSSSSSFEVTVQTSIVPNQTVTAGKEVSLTAPNATGALQWQVSSDNGSTWSNLANDSTYNGVTTGTLHIANATNGLNALLFQLITATNGKATAVYSAKLNVIAAFVPFPVGLSADGSGNLYVTDTAKDTVEKINLSAQVATFAGLSGQTGTANGAGSAARFNDPAGVVAAYDGSLAVTDKANGTIRLISSIGTVTTLAGSTTLRGNVDGSGTAATFSSPTGIARDSAGNFYVADAQNHTIRKITSTGVVSTLAGSAGQSGSKDGVGAAARFNNPTGIDVDTGGTLYVADTTNNLIRKITSDGTVTTLAGLAGVSGFSDGSGNMALFNQPAGVAVDLAGNVYVADTGSSTIRRVSPAGTVTTVAGLPGIAGLKDGAGIEAWFNQPRDVALSSTGYLYVADTGNASIRRIDQSGNVITVALSSVPSVDTTPTLPLPQTPTLPSTPSTPTLPTSPTPTTSSSGGGGGGGAPSLWLLAGLGTLWLVRRRMARNE